MGSVADGRGCQDEKATKSPSKMNYRELQKECKRLGLKATGRADELRQQLLNGPIPESEAALEQVSQWLIVKLSNLSLILIASFLLSSRPCEVGEE
jgi:hypothetical protein